MKVCVVSPGVVHAVPRSVAIAKYFDAVHFVDIVAKADPAQLERHGVRYHGPAGTGGSINRKQLRRLFREINPDLIICHFASGDHFFNAIAWGECPVAVVAMGQDVLYEAGDVRVSPMRRLLTRMALRRCCYISAKSEYLARRIRSFGVKAPVEVNYWGADLEHFSPGDRKTARRELGWEENGIYLLSPRAIEPRLNIDVIVDAFAAVRARFPDAKLVILGRSNPDYLRRIEGQIERLGIRDRIILSGEVTQVMLPVYYRASDLVLSMAASEGFPNTILEVMGCRVPVMIGRIRQIEELLEDGSNAIVCEIDPGEIAGRIIDFIGRGPDERLMEAALELVKHHANIAESGARFSENLMLHVQSRGRLSSTGSLLFLCVYVLHLVGRKLHGKWTSRVTV